jgi:hypothetical protein
VSNGDGPELTARIAQRGREVVVARLRDAFAHQVATRASGGIDPARLERMVQEAASRAGDALWRRSLAEAVMEELGLGLPEALAHPVLTDARELVDAQNDAAPPTPEPEPSEPPEPPERAQPQPDRGPERGYDSEVREPGGGSVSMLAEPHALRLSAVHVSGIETLQQGDGDLELRLSEAGLDVLKRSNGAAIGRLEWSEIEGVSLPAPKRGLRSRRRPRELHVSTRRGQAQFELPGLSDEELHEHLEPTLARLRGTAAGTRAAAQGDGAGGSSAGAS